MKNAMPAVSIILPTYNRARFLPQALESIRAQEWTDWELIVVDDGSTDETRELVTELTRGWEQPVRYIYQENQGAYGARNTGLDLAKGKYIAFYDSDDLWLVHHLKDCAEALEANEDVDWVWGACRIVNHSDGKTICESTFYVDRRERPFLALKHEHRDALHVIADPSAACCHVLRGFYCGLQNSVIRNRVFTNYRFAAEERNEAEDQLIVIWALLEGFRFGYLNRVNAEYRVHEENSSAAGHGVAVEKKTRVLRLLTEGYERFLASPGVPAPVRQAIRRRLGREYFWNIGYSTLWASGQRNEALRMFRRGLRYWPWDWRCWKTLVTARAKVALGRT